MIFARRLRSPGVNLEDADFCEGGDNGRRQLDVPFEDSDGTTEIYTLSVVGSVRCV